MKAIQNTGSTKLSSLIFILFSFYITHINAQNILVSAKLDTNCIKIGKQTRITLKANTEKGVHVLFPEIKDTITDKIEVVSVGKVDTAIVGNQVSFQKSIIITSFDSGYYAIPPFVFSIKNDSTKKFETEALLFSVITIPVDTTLAIKGIKPPLNPAWSIYEIEKELLIGLILLLVCIVVIVLLKRRKKVEQVSEIIELKRPAHEIALEALNELRNQKLWQQGRVKEYHIQVSDIVRTYIEHRYAIFAMEMTSDEILRSLRLIIVDVQLKTKLSSVLILSDMVKFAKENPLPNENELSWEHAIEFVKQTSLINEKEEIKP
jgi:hypothetical protein